LLLATSTVRRIICSGVDPFLSSLVGLGLRRVPLWGYPRHTPHGGIRDPGRSGAPPAWVFRTSSWIFLGYPRRSPAQFGDRLGCPVEPRRVPARRLSCCACRARSAVRLRRSPSSTARLCYAPSRQPCLQQPDSAGGLAQQKPGSGPGPSLVADETKFGPGLPSLPQLPTSSYASGAGAADAARRRGGGDVERADHAPYQRHHRAPPPGARRSRPRGLQPRASMGPGYLAIVLPGVEPTVTPV
jgi:hypothetical protein